MATSPTAAKRASTKGTRQAAATNGRKRAPRKLVPMTPKVRAAAGLTMSAFENALLDAEGFAGSSTRELKSGALMKAVKIDGHRAVVTIRYR